MHIKCLINLSHPERSLNSTWHAYVHSLCTRHTCMDFSSTQNTCSPLGLMTLLGVCHTEVCATNRKSLQMNLAPLKASILYLSD